MKKPKGAIVSKAKRVPKFWKSDLNEIFFATVKLLRAKGAEIGVDPDDGELYIWHKNALNEKRRYRFPKLEKLIEQAKRNPPNY